LCRVEEIEWRRPAGEAKVGGVISAFSGAMIILLYQGATLVSSTTVTPNAVPPALQISSVGFMGIER
jgi:hypothetical protein